MLNTKILILFIRISFALDWIKNENFEYLIASDDKISFINATTEECKSKGAEALTLNSEEEINFIKSKCPKCNFWLPFRRNGSKEFIGLTNNEVLDTKIVQWSIGEPKNEFCVEYRNGLLYTLNCNLQNGYACRRKYIPESSVRKIRQASVWSGEIKDPCAAHSVWKDNKSRAPVSDPPVEILCDDDLEPGWYRLNSSAGNRMPTTCVRPPGCGTLQPIWMEGNLPSEDDGIVIRKACVSSGTNCCASSWNIKVKACSGYYVYFLQDTTSCFRAYCIGKTKAECLDCDFGVIPTLTEQPTVNWRNINSQLELVCDTNYKLKHPADVPYIFEIDWFADDQHIHREVLSVNRNQASLTEKYLIGKFGKKITCQVRGKFDGDFSPKKTSNGFLFGIQINNPGSSLVLKPGEAGKISFKLMFPIICPREVRDCSLRLFTGLDLTNAQPTCPDQIKIDEAVIKCPTSNINNAFCGLVITNKNWDQTHEISIAATIHSQTTITKKFSIKLCTFDTIFPLWRDITIEIPIQVTITALNIINNICHSYNDPHMMTFDGMRWEHPYVGTYILYRNTKSRFEVQAYYTTCPGAPTVTCNCAVAIKSSDKLITIDRCATGNMDPLGKKIPRAALIRAITLPSPKENERKTRIYRHEEGRRYEIHFPTGTYVDVTQAYANLINIAIRASAYDISSTEGLCGTFNGNTGDDYKLRDGSFACNPTAYCAKFSKDWEVSIHKGGLFIEQYDTSTTFNEDIFCKCIMKDGKLPDKSCQHNNNIQVCQNVKNGKDITQQLNDIGDKKKRSTYHDYVEDNHFDANWAAEYLNKRKKREVEDDKIAKTWTIDTARKHCQESLKTSSAGKFCDKVPNVEFNSKIEFCILDIMASQSTVYVKTAEEAVKEECMTELNRNTSLWVQNNDPKTGQAIFIPPPEIEGNLCINDCNNHGTCEKGVCKCDKGFQGGDCSIKAGVPPEVYYIPQGGLCDKQSRPCASTVVYGLNFVDSDQLTCHLEIVSITMPNGGYHPLETNPVNVKASFESFGEVRCPIPITKDKDIASWIIYISNDGKLKSKDGVLFTVYNSNCILCKPEGMCSLEVNSCLIQNQCFKAGESNGAKRPCEKCRPEINANQWTKESACAITSNTTPPSTKFLCLSAWGLYTHPLRCTHYIECRNWQPFVVSCGLAQYYNPATKSCVNPREVPHCNKGKWF